MLYPETQEERDAIKSVAKRLASLKRLEYMHNRYGTALGKKCGDCRHFRAYKMSGTYFKCALYRISSSSATDWRVKWDACGLWENHANRTLEYH
jgi:threonine dehydratase